MDHRVLSSKFAGMAMLFLLLTGMASAGQSVAPAGEQDAISIPQLINYQGYLTDGAGDPLTGTYSMGFRILDAATGGTSWWNETQPGVSVSEGVFNVILGSVTPIAALPEGPDCYLEITVGTELIAPRVRLVSVPYSYGADVAADAEALGGIAAANNVHNATTAGGDLAGTYPSPTVAQKGATSGQVLKWNGSAWAPADDQAGTSRWTDQGSYIYANNNSNARVYDVGQLYGVYGHSTRSSSGRPHGVYGYAYNSYGNLNYGGCGVYGYGAGYYGQTYGVYGYATVTNTLSSYPAYGVYGYTNSDYGRGVTGYASGSYSYGVYGLTNSMSSYGVYGFNGYASLEHAGVYGCARYSGVVGYNLYYGYRSILSYQGYKVYGSGSVSTYILDENGDERVLHCPEMPEVLFEDVGSNRLENGYRRVNIDPLLLRGVIINDEFPLRVFVTMNDECGTFRVEKHDTYFEVVENNGSSNARFDWRIVANRKGHQNLRLENRGRPEEMRGVVDKTPMEVEPEIQRTPYDQ